MKFSFIVLASLFSINTLAQDVWVQRDSVNGPPRGACAAFTLNGEGFIVAGVNTEELKRKLYSYDLDQDDWDDEVALGGDDTGDGLERSSAIAFAAAGYGFVGLGSGAAAYYKDLWRYDPETETWTQMADFAGTARLGAVAFAIDHKGYVGTGQDIDGFNNDFYQYDPLTNTWTAVSNFSGGARKEAVGFTMGGKAYVGTGRSSTGYLSDFWEYNATTDEWTQKANFPGTARMGAVGCGVFPSAFIMLGEDHANFKSDVWEYHYFGDVWTQRANYPGGSRSQASAFVVDDRIFVGLGYNGLYHDDFYEYERILAVSENPVSALQLYPNPTQGTIYVQLPYSVNNSKLQVMDMMGNVIYQTNINVTQNNQCKIDLPQQLATGIYTVVLSGESGVISTSKISLKK